MKNTIKQIAITTFTVIATLLLVNVFTNKNENNQTETLESPTTNKAWYASMPAASAAPTDFTLAAERSIPAVVHVKVKVQVQSQTTGDSFLDMLFGERPQQKMGSGSGVIISKDGYIVTNNHVIDQSNAIQVVLDDKRTYDAKVVGADPQTDLALLKIDEENLEPLSFGNSDAVKVGEWVLAIGNPINLSTTVTAGIVSAKTRGIGIIANRNNQYGIESFIQTDAAVNPGNSGGALVNTNGELIGINTAIASPTGSYAGYSFAVPVSIVKKVVADLMEFGQVKRAILGIRIFELTPEYAKANNINTLNGVVIDGINRLGSADEAGLKRGDIITEIDNRPIKSSSELQEYVGRHRPGDKIAITYLRNNKSKTTTTVLHSLQGEQNMASAGNNTKTNQLGANFTPINAQTKRKFNIAYGVHVNNLEDGLLKEHGIQEGYIITKINGQRIIAAEDVLEAYKTAEEALFLTGLYPNGRVAVYAISLTE